MSNLVELFDNVVEFQNYNGVPLAAGKLYVFALGRTRLMDTWSDVDGESLNPNPIILDDLGQCHCYVSDSFDYTIVVCDQFDNEVFSVDKYLLSKGEHSHADVAVAPSEHIGVSSYHVGEVTVYVPYLTGEVGKTYEGIDPIVVNNTLNRISANHIPLGVQDPLYFVEDSETACILGCSAQTEIPAELSGKWDEASDAVIANSAQWAEGTEYEAGNYISIDNNTLSVTGLSPVPADTASTGLVAEVSADIISQIPSTAGLATTAQLDEKLDKSDSANFYPMEGNPSGFLTAHQSLQGYATEQWVEGKGYLTAVDIPESAVWNATTQTVSANSAQWAGGTANPQIPVTSTSGISIFESGDKVYFNISADYALNSDLENVSAEITGMIPAPFDPTYLSGQIDTKLDSAIYATASGTFLTALPQDLVYTADIQDMATTGQVAEKLDTTAFSTVSGDFLTAVDLTPYQEKADMTAYATVESLTAKQDAGNYLSATDSANFLLTSDSGNFYPMNENPSGYLTAHQSLADYQTTADMVNYQTTAGMTAYQEAGDYLTTADSANFYTTANESGYITGVPDTYLQNTDLATSDGKVTAISGIPLSAGGDVPEGVMVESGLEYNTVNEISGYNGSAIAQYGAEKQWLVHDDTLVHAANSAQYALGVNLSAVAQLLGVDETVLFSASTSAGVLTANLSEPLSSFKTIEVYSNRKNAGALNLLGYTKFNTDYKPEFISITGNTKAGTNETYLIYELFNVSQNALTFVSGTNLQCIGTSAIKVLESPSFANAGITKVIGIGRKS